MNGLIPPPTARDAWYVQSWHQGGYPNVTAVVRVKAWIDGGRGRGKLRRALWRVDHRNESGGGLSATTERPDRDLFDTEAEAWQAAIARHQERLGWLYEMRDDLAAQIKIGEAELQDVQQMARFKALTGSGAAEKA